MLFSNLYTIQLLILIPFASLFMTIYYVFIHYHLLHYHVLPVITTFLNGNKWRFNIQGLLPGPTCRCVQ